MSITVKLVNGTQKTVDVPKLDIKVEELKVVLSAAVDIPADEQRIVLRGRILKDEDILSDAGLEHGNSIHVVRKKKPQVELAASCAAPAQANTATAPPAAPAAPATAPAAATNQYAALASGLFGRNFQSGSGAGFDAGAMPNLGQALDMASYMQGAGALNSGAATPGRDDALASMRAQVMQNPAMMDMTAQLMRNPQFMQHMMQENPMMAGMTPEMQQNMLTLMSNPEFMRLALNLSSSMGGGALPPAATAAGQLPSFSAQAPNANSGGGLNSLASMNALLSSVQGNPRELYREQLQQLREMGFFNEEANIAALQQSHGNMDFAIERLFSP